MTTKPCPDASEARKIVAMWSPRGSTVEAVKRMLAAGAGNSARFVERSLAVEIVATAPPRVLHAVRTWVDDHPLQVSLYPAYEPPYFLAERVWEGRWRHRLTSLGRAVRQHLEECRHDN